MEKMNEEGYWAIVARSLRASQNQTGQEQILLSALKEMTTQEMIGFHLTTSHLLNETYTAEMWCAAHIMNTRCSDDGFEDFRHWVISRGREVYYKAKVDPDTLVNEYMEGCEAYAFERFGYVAMEAFEETTGEELFDAIEDSGIVEVAFIPIEFNWKANDPESMKRICPRLYALFVNITGSDA
jgi:Protein of unknown function (DUF4240)